MAEEYVFLDEWDVDAPQDAVFNALADARTYPDWWRPVYIDVSGDAEPVKGVTTKQHFKGKLPYTLRTTFRWKHNWSAARAKDGLEPYARSRSS